MAEAQVGTHRTVAAIVLLRADGAALLQHRDDRPDIPHPGLWTPPGGHCESGESLEHCARREFLEETNYRCDEILWLTTFEDRVEGHRPCWLTVFWAQYDGRQVPVCREGEALQFIRREDASAYPIPAYLVRVWDRALAAASTTAGDRRVEAAERRA